MDQFQKRVLILRQTLIGRGYYNALIAMEFAAKYHKGTRRDKVTPEFDHQVSIALFALTLPNIIDMEALIAVIMLHDVREDYDITDGEIRALFADKDFANLVANAVDKMTKEWRGEKKDERKLFDAMAEDFLASVAKLCDRVHNLQSMVGVFKIEKQKDYIAEAEELFFPMLKKARRNFPHQVLAYENLKWMLRSQIQLIQAMHAVLEPAVAE